MRLSVSLQPERTFAYLSLYTRPINALPMDWKKQIPNFFTTLNLISGLVAITLILDLRFALASLFILAAALFDFFDGMMARWLRAWSELGKQLDSLADLVSFGVAPGILMYRLISLGCTGSCNILEQLQITPYFALLIPVCSAFRLAKFNIDTRQETHFIGLPTPANALFFASIPLILYTPLSSVSIIPPDVWIPFFQNTRVLAILVVLFSYLLISDFRLFSLKFKHLQWKDNEMRYIFLFSCILWLLLFSVSGLPLIIFTYFFLSLVFQRHILTRE